MPFDRTEEPRDPLVARRAALRADVDRTVADNSLKRAEDADVAAPTGADATPRVVKLVAAALAKMDRAAGGAAKRVRDLPYGEGPRRTLDVFRPRKPTRSAPVIVFFYGGAWRSGSKDETAFVGLALARLGHVVVVPDHRLVPEVRFPAFLHDAADAVAWTRAHAAEHGGDPDRLVLMGHSAGAHTAMMLGLDRAYLDARGVPAAAVRALVGLAGPYDFHPFPLKLCEDAFGAAEDPATTQPVTFARADAPPSLLIAGEADRHVPHQNTIAMAETLAAAGARTRLRLMPDLGHLGPLVALSHVLGRGSTVRAELVDFLAAEGLAPPEPTPTGDAR